MRSTLFLALYVLISFSATAQPTWVQTNGPQGATGGAVQSLTLIKWTNYIFAGTFGGGVQRSSDGGATWNAVNTGLTDLKVHRVWSDWSNWSAHTIFAATYTGGIFRTVDSGQHWSAVNNGLNATEAYCFAPDGRGGILTGTTNGICKSTNEGTTWTDLSGTNLAGPVNAIIFTDSGYVIAGTSNGIFKSTDLGVHWTKTSTFNPMYVSELTRGYDANYYASVENGGGVYKSTNGGNTWTAINTGLTNLEVKCLATDDSTQTLFAGTRGNSGTGGVYVSTNWGTSWNTTSLSGVDVNSVLPGKIGTVFAGSNTGVQRSVDTGKTFTTSFMMGSDVMALAALSDSTALASASLIGLFHTSDAGTSWQLAASFGDSNTTCFTVAPNGVIYAGTEGASVQQSADNGVTWQPVGLTNYYAGAIVAGNDGAIYVGTYTAGIFRSATGVAPWTAVLTNGLQNKQVTALARDSAGRLYAGTDAAGAFTSTDSGATWHAINSGLNGAITAMCAAPNGKLFASTSTGVYRSVNQGASWTLCSGGAPTSNVTTIAANQQSLLFAGTKNNGVYASTDYGVTWSAANNGLDTKIIRSLAFGPHGTAYAGTTGGGVYRTTATTIIGPSNPVLIAAVPTNDTVTMTWNTNPESSIARYVIVYGLDADPTMRMDSTANNTDTSFVVTGLQLDTMYFFRIIAVDTAGRESLYSNEIAAMPTASVPGELVPDQQTSALWHVDRNGADASGHGNTAVNHNVKYAAGRIGNAWKFDRTNAHLTVVNAPSLNPATALSVETWFQTTSATAEQFMVGKRGAQDTAMQYALMITNGKLHGVVKIKNAPTHVYGKTVITTNSWHHAAVVYDGAAMVLYLDGVEESRVALTGRVFTTSYPVYIGGPVIGTRGQFAGMIDEVRISRTARTPDQFTLGRPDATTLAAARIDEATFALNGRVNPHGVATTVHFEWDTTATLAHADTTASHSVGNGMSDSAVTARIAVVSPYTYYYRLVATSASGTTRGEIMTIATANAVREAITPDVPLIAQNYPNPFTSSTVIRVAPGLRGTDHATLRIVDMFGCNVADLSDALRADPRGVEFRGEGLPGGVYLCVLEAPGVHATRRITLVR